jgi:hypothetical protein
MHRHLLELVFGEVKYAVLERTARRGLEGVDNVRALAPFGTVGYSSGCELAVHKQAPLPDSIAEETKTNPTPPPINGRTENEFECDARRGMQ